MRYDDHCRSCHAPIRWAITSTGKRMPLDPVARADGNVIVEQYELQLIDGRESRSTPVVRVLARADAVPSSEPLRYVSHFVTCPHADRHRRSTSSR